MSARQAQVGNISFFCSRIHVRVEQQLATLQIAPRGYLTAGKGWREYSIALCIPQLRYLPGIHSLDIN